MRVQVKATALIPFAAMALPLRLLLGNWDRAAGCAFLISLSLLLHEFGHAVVARSYGVPVKEIGLCLLGAYTVRNKSPQWRVELQTAIAGPLANCVLAAAFACLPGSMSHLLAMSNLLLALTNLVPIAPSDGWRLWQLLCSRTS